MVKVQVHYEILKDKPAGGDSECDCYRRRSDVEETVISIWKHFLHFETHEVFFIDSSQKSIRNYHLVSVLW